LTEIVAATVIAYRHHLAQFSALATLTARRPHKALDQIAGPREQASAPLVDEIVEHGAECVGALVR